MLQTIIPRVNASWITIFVLTLWCTIRAIQFTKFVVRHDVTDSHCVAGDEVFSRHVAGGLVDCVTRCESPACLSVFYTEESDWCQGCGGVYQNYSNLVQSNGASYFNKLPCQPPWMSYGRSCYYHPGNADEEKRTFIDGWNFCKALNGTLASIDDKPENDFLKYYLQNYGGDDQHYLGYIRREGSSEFVFYGDDRPMVYTNWHRRYPTDDVWDQCLIMREAKGNWRHANCTIPKSPLCEKDALY